MIHKSLSNSKFSVSLCGKHCTSSVIDWDLVDCPQCKNIKEDLMIFREMVDDWRDGRPVSKICYALTNKHMEVLCDLLY